MAYDTQRKRTVMFGGGEAGLAFGETWEWDGAIWTEVASFGAPGSAGAAMAYDGNAVAFFGGIDSLEIANRDAKLFGDTWEWDGKHWTLRQDIGPSARRGHAMAFDSKRKHLVLFGGSTSLTQVTEDQQGDTWEHSEQ